MAIALITDSNRMSIFRRIGVLTYRFRFAVLVIWGVILVASAFFAPDLSGRLKGGGFEGSNSEAERVQDLMTEEFGVSPATLTVVFDGGGIPATGERFRQAEAQALEDVREMDEVRSVATYAGARDRRFLSEDGEKSYAVVAFDISIDETRNVVKNVRSRVRSEELDTYVTGAPAVYQDLERASNEDIKRAEKYAFPFALVILLIAFGSVVAAAVPAVIGGVSVLTALAVLYFVAGSYDMSVFVLTLSTMLGLGLGIDYALFFVSRFREELGHFDVSEAIPRTVATAGRSIFFSGTAVLIGLSGLLFFPFMFMRSIGIAGVLVVFVSVAAALTLAAGLSRGARAQDQLALHPPPPGHRWDGLLERQRRARDASPIDRHPSRRRAPRGPAIPGRPYEGRDPGGQRAAGRIRVPRRGRHFEERVRLPGPEPYGGRRDPAGGPAERRGPLGRAGPRGEHPGNR